MLNHITGMGRPVCGPPHRHYTGAEIDAANDTDLPALLSRLGYHVRRVDSYYTTREIDSLRIKNRRIWYRYSEATGGDAIAFVRHFCGLPFPEAVRYLLAFNGYPAGRAAATPIPRTRPPPRQERRPFVLPPPNGGSGRVCAYLRGRGISPGVIDSFIGLGLLYEDARYHNCVFVGRDGAGKPVFAAKRGTWFGSSFRGDVAGSDKRIAFRVPCGPVLDWVAVFEAPIDLMSWFTLYGPCNAIALCGLHDAPLGTYLADHPHIRRIVLCLDADGPGREAAGKLGEKYRGLGYGTEERFPPSGKDWTEYLIMMGKNQRPGFPPGRR